MPVRHHLDLPRSVAAAVFGAARQDVRCSHLAFVRLARFLGAREHHFRALAAAMGDVEAPEGRLVFAAGPVEDGWQVVQVWTDRHALDRFNAAHFLPALVSLGDSAFPHPPVVVDFETAVFDVS